MLRFWLLQTLYRKKFHLFTQHQLNSSSSISMMPTSIRISNLLADIAGSEVMWQPHMGRQQGGDCKQRASVTCLDKLSRSLHGEQGTGRGAAMRSRLLCEILALRKRKRRGRNRVEKSVNIQCAEVLLEVIPKKEIEGNSRKQEQPSHITVTF